MSSNPLPTNIDNDDDFDFYYDYSKAAQNRSEAWTPENWESEMEKHPMFMSSVPEPGQESPLVEAITQLKYDPEFNSVSELMDNYRVDGNENFKLKKYSWAIASYSEGIKIARTGGGGDKKKTEKEEPETSSPSSSVQPEDREEKVKIRKLLSVLYNNRSTAHFYLKNYRSSALDATRALMLDPANHKALLRVARCYFELDKFEKCIEFCSHHLDAESELSFNSSDLAKLIQDSRLRLQQSQRDQRQRKLREDKQKLEQSKIESAVSKLRGIQFRGSLFETDHSAAYGHFVHFVADANDPGSHLIWPVIFVYPKYGQCDFIQEFSEATTFREQLETMFAEPPEWNPEKDYRPDRLKLFYHSYEDEQYNSQLKLVQFDPELTLLQALQLPHLIVTNAIPTFFVGLDTKF